MTLEQALRALSALEPAGATPGRIRVDGENVWIDNPGAKGALTVTMMRELGLAVQALQQADGAVVVVRGTPGSFCSGGHLRQVQQSLIRPAQGVQMARAMTAVLDSLLRLPQVVVAAVDGPALGGGAELLTACDHRVFGPRGRVGFIHAQLGVAPGWGGAARLSRLLGRGRALRCLSSGRVFNRDEALAMGLADHVGDSLEDALGAFLAPIRRAFPPAVRACKRQLMAAETWTRTGAEAEIFGTVWGGVEHQERLAAALD